MAKRFKMKDRPQYLLSISTAESTLKNILARVQDLPAIQLFKNYLLFSDIEKIKKDFANAWVDYQGKKVEVLMS